VFHLTLRPGAASVAADTGFIINPIPQAISMSRSIPTVCCAAALLAGLSAAAMAQTASAQSPSSSRVQVSTSVQHAPPPENHGAGDSVMLYFNTASSTIRPQDRTLLDQAARLYRDGHPLVMIVSGEADSVGSGETNLIISQNRAMAVAHALIARGIPADRLQVLAKGSTEPTIPQAAGVPEPGNRRVEIRWR
jgi:outer membrane protein OmpA-like peptidoglycan-associated protein